MSKRIPSKDEALEALDFIVSVLKEHEKDLDRLINELGTITERLGDTGELSGKVEKVEGRLSTLQNEITNLITYLSNPHETQPTSATQIMQQAQFYKFFLVATKFFCKKKSHYTHSIRMLCNAFRIFNSAQFPSPAFFFFKFFHLKNKIYNFIHANHIICTPKSL